MSVIAFDTETHLIQPGVLAPRLICLTMCEPGGKPSILVPWEHDIEKEFRQLLEGDDVLVGANTPFDMAVVANHYPSLLPLVFDKYARLQVTDVQNRQRLIDIAHGLLGGGTVNGRKINYKYSLADLVARLLHEDRSHLKTGDDIWRLRYSELDGVLLKEWPKEALDYALGDAQDTARLWQAQQKHEDKLEDEFRQCRAHFALHLMSCRGIMTDDEAVQAYAARTEAELEKARARLLELGWVQPRSKKNPELKRNVKVVTEYAEKKHGKYIDRTEKGNPSLTEESVAVLGDIDLVLYQRYASASTIVSNIEDLKKGTRLPIQTRFVPILDTGRTSSQKPNIQNRRKSFGDRECFVPRPGFVFANADYDGLELRTIAQSCIFAIGRSKLADVLNAGEDPHVMLASTLLGINYEEGKKRRKAGDAQLNKARDTAKMGNFGFNGGLGPVGFIHHAMTFGVYELCENKDHNRFFDTDSGLCVLCLQRATQIRDGWFATWPEMTDFFTWIRSILGRAGVATIRHFGSNRWRGHLPYTVLCNTFSQALGSDATKEALFDLSRTCYTVKTSPLYGSYPVNYVHDEFITEVRDDYHRHERALELSRIMCEGANRWLPDVPTTAEPLLMRRWSKNAKSKYDSDGRLVPWDCDIHTGVAFTSPEYTHGRLGD